MKSIPAKTQSPQIKKKAKAKQASSLLPFSFFLFPCVYSSHAFDVETIKEETKSWAGKLPANPDGEYRISLISNYKVADYTLEILLQ